MKEINIVVAVSLNGVIGLRESNSMPWHLPPDLARFKELTLGHTIIMGARTYESIGHPLKNRRNVVISSKTRPDVVSYTSLADAYEMEDGKLFVIGGQKIFEDAFANIKPKNLYVTVVEKNIPESSSNATFPIQGSRFGGEFLAVDGIVYNEISRSRIIDDYDDTFRMTHYRRGNI